MIGLRQRAWWTGAATGTVALAVVPSILEPLRVGGIAPVLVAAFTAAALGAPLARVEWRRRVATVTATDRAVDALGELLVVTWISAVASAWWPVAWRAAFGVLLWAIAALAVVVRRDRAAVGLAVLCVVQAALATGLGFVEAGPWTMLTPRWDAWPQWLPWSLLSGLLLAGAGAAHWSRAPEGPPGTGHAVWLPLGVALAVTTATACRAGSRFESELGMAPDLLALGVGAVALTAAATGALAGAPTKRKRMAFAGVVAALWFSGPAGATTSWFLAVWLPLGIVAILAWRTWRDPGPSRWVAAAGAAVAAVVVVAGWPGIPTSPPVAVGAALTGVALLWVAGTRALIEADPDGPTLASGGAT